MRVIAANLFEPTLLPVPLDGHLSRMLSTYMPAHLLVDAATGVVITFDGPAKLFLAPWATTTDLDLFHLLRDDLQGPVRTALFEAATDRKSVCHHVLTRGASGVAIDLIIAVEAVEALAEVAAPLQGGQLVDAAIRYFVVGLYPQPAATQVAWSGELAGDILLSKRAQEAEKRALALQAVVENLRGHNLDLITRNDHLARQYETSVTLLDSTRIATVFLDSDLRIRGFTRVISGIFAFRDTDVGRPLLDLVCRLDYPDLAGDLERAVQTQQPLERELIDRGPDERVFLMRMRPQSRVDDALGGMVLTFVDITTRKRAEDKAWFLAHHDQLTGLPNRTRFHAMLDEIAARNPPSQGWLGLMFLDLDRFKAANDTFGHAVGDQLLQHVADRLRVSLPPNAKIYRFGGDEFAIVQHSAGKPIHLEQLAMRLLVEISLPYLVEHHLIQVGTSVGISSQPCAELNREALARAADLALYQAKADGRGTVRAFQPHLEAEWQRKRDIERDLGSAISAGQMSIAYQPIVRISDRRIVGAEALLRWHHPHYGALSPAQFIPVSEQSGQIVPIGLWVLETACREAARWTGTVGLSVNLSSVQFASLDLVDKVLDVLARTGLDPARLTLEVTETVLLQDDERTRDVLAALHRAGVAIAVDDFGTGYASLSYLLDFAFQKIKIDRTFIRTMDSQAASTVIVEAIRTIGRGLGIGICAEGVETEAQLSALHQLGVEEAQGFLLFHPMLDVEFSAVLQDATAVPVVPTPGVVLDPGQTRPG